jgi:hypothetical protein
MEKPLDAYELLHTIQLLLGQAQESEPGGSMGTFYYIAA